MRISEQFKLLVAEFEQDWAFIQENFRKNQEMAGRIRSFPESDEFAYAALGHTLHNLYYAFEGYFLRVAKFFENGIGESGLHKNLLERKTLAIDGVRPAITPKKLMLTQEAAEGLENEFFSEHQRLISILQQTIIKLEEC